MYTREQLARGAAALGKDHPLCPVPAWVQQRTGRSGNVSRLGVVDCAAWLGLDWLVDSPPDASSLQGGVHPGAAGYRALLRCFAHAIERLDEGVCSSSSGMAPNASMLQPSQAARNNSGTRETRMAGTPAVSRAVQIMRRFAHYNSQVYATAPKTWIEF